MMNTYKSLEEALIGMTQKLFDNGKDVSSRGSNQKELLFENMVILDPTAVGITNPARKFNANYAFTEWLWYLSGDPEVKNIGKFAKIWLDIQDQDGKVESNYGTYLMGTQWLWILKELKNDKDSRRCTMIVHQPMHKYKNKADLPCTQYIQFFIRDNKLHMGVSMRSNDLIYGFCNDVFTFTMFQQLMLNDLRAVYPDLELGHYYHHAGSIHMYERHYGMAENILAASKIGYALSKVNYTLKDDVTTEEINKKALYLPTNDMEKEEITDVVSKIVKEIFV